MANNIEAGPNQSMQDLALMASGTLEAAMALCRANNISVSDAPTIAGQYLVPVGLTKDRDAYREIIDKAIVIGTLAEEVMPGHFRVVLKAQMRADPILPPGEVDYELRLMGTDEFINHNELPDEWPTSNVLKHELKSAYETDLGVGATIVSPFPSLQGEKLAEYIIGSSLVVGQVHMWWSPSLASHITLTYQDAAGCRSVFSPLLLLPVDGSAIAQVLIATLEVTEESVEDGVTYLRFTRGHPPISVPDFNIQGQGWLSWVVSGWTGLDGTIIDDDNIVVGFSPGLYEVGVKTAYRNDANTLSWPTSVISMTIEVF